MRLALIGCGHIGGSLALALRRSGAVSGVVGHDADPEALSAAQTRGICDTAADTAAAAVQGAQVVVLAVPVAQTARVAAAIAPSARGAVVTDVGSTKARVVTACQAVLGGSFVGGHPIAGTERSGPDAADAALFVGRRVVLTPTCMTDRSALHQVTGLWRAAGAEVSELDPAQHDRIMAAASHLPHVVAYSLAGSVADMAPELAGFAGPSFADTTRVAATRPAMWVELFLDNREALLPLVEGLCARIQSLRAAILAADTAELERLLGEARAAREQVLSRSGHERR